MAALSQVMALSGVCAIDSQRRGLYAALMCQYRTSSGLTSTGVIVPQLDPGARRPRLVGAKAVIGDLLPVSQPATEHVGRDHLGLQPDKMGLIKLERTGTNAG